MFHRSIPSPVRAAQAAQAGFAALAITLAGCAGTKLDTPPVESRTPVSTAAPAGPGSGAQSRVAPVVAAQPAADAAGPAATARLVYFDYDSSAIRPEFQGLLDAHARFLRSHATRKVVVEGHTDERGGREYNLALGQQRSEAVRRALGLLGVGSGQVEAISFGEERPAATGSGEEAWSRNRRAEIAYR